jgi:hypothetical protein
VKHEEEADELEREADHLEKHSDTVGDHIKEAREDFEEKAKSQDAPGAQAAEDAPGEDEEA